MATVLWAGGRWDLLDRKFTDTDPEYAKVIDLEESQVAFVEWYATWLRDFREGFPRDISLVLNAGGRRGGKTFSAVLCQIAALIDVPYIGNNRHIGWVISETFKKRMEIEEEIANNIPNPDGAGWYEHWKAPEYRYEFTNGGLLRNLSAQDPEDLRQGQVDTLTYNEPQQMQAKAVVNGLFGTADKGGLTVLAANPPTMIKGEWTIDLKEAIDQGKAPQAKYFFFDAKLNTQVDQYARSRVADLARIINPSQMAADDEGSWNRIGDRAYDGWKPEYLAKAPDVGDITAEVLKRHAGCHRAMPYLGGADFQGYPFNAGVLWKIFHGDKGWIYWAVDEFMVEGDESYLIAEVRERDYDETDIFWIGDASGQWQDGKHDFGKGGNSFAAFRRDHWRIVPPREKKTDAATYSSNPMVESRLRVIRRIMDECRIRVDPDRCPALALAFKECALKRSGTRVFKKGVHAHLSDAADYSVYWCDPKPKIRKKGSIARSAESLPHLRPGAGIGF